MTHVNNLRELPRGLCALLEHVPLHAVRCDTSNQCTCGTVRWLDASSIVLVLDVSRWQGGVKGEIDGARVELIDSVGGRASCFCIGTRMRAFRKIDER